MEKCASKCIHPYSSTLAGQKIKQKRAATWREVTLPSKSAALLSTWSDLQLRLPIFDLVLRSPWKLDHPWCHTKILRKKQKNWGPYQNAPMLWNTQDVIGTNMTTHDHGWNANTSEVKGSQWKSRAERVGWPNQWVKLKKTLAGQGKPWFFS